MPIDPTIISQGMANMPDVNALLQQQITGMENINALERQRRADELDMQDRAAAAAKEQEDAAVKALLPAYSYVLRTGDLAGGLKLAPAEYQDSLAPYMEELQGKSLPEIQAALTGSLVTSDVGRAFLENEARLRTAQIQQGQLDVSREDIVLRRQKQALDARGDGEWTLESGEDENGRPIFVWTNPRTRQIIKADITDGVPAVTPEAAPGLTSIPAPLPSTDLVTPRAPAPGAPEVAAPISVAQPPAEQPGAKFRPKPKKEDEMTQEERRRAASVRYAVKNVEKVLQTIDKDPASFGQGADEFALSLIPFGAGEDFKSFVQDANREQVYYRMNQTVATLLRLATGAAFTTPELVTEASSFMPKFGDDPATARDKLDALQDRIISEVGSTGRGFTPEDQAELNALLGAFETMKNKLYPEQAAGGDDLPEGTTSSNW